MVAATFWAVPVLTLALLAAAPYTHSKELFVLQAVYDLVNHGWDLDAFHHLASPGGVPHTFIGAVLVAPVVALVKLVPCADATQFPLQIAARVVVALANCWALYRFQAAVARRSPHAGWWFPLVAALLASLALDLSRTVPVYMASALSTYALSQLLDGNHRWALMVLALAAAVFSAELGMLVVALVAALTWLAPLETPTSTRLSTFLRRLRVVVLGTILGAALLVAVDLFFWNRPTWPELQVVLFTVLQGRPPAWSIVSYRQFVQLHIFTVVGFPPTLLLLVPGVFGVDEHVEKQAEDRKSPVKPTPYFPLLFVIAGLYLAALPLQPRQDGDLLVYVVPLLAAVMARGAHEWTLSKLFSLLTHPYIKTIGVLLLVFVNFVVLLGVLYVARLDFPGGEALVFLNSHIQHLASAGLLVEGNYNLTLLTAVVHAEAAALRRGVTPFLALREPVQLPLGELVTVEYDTSELQMTVYLRFPDYTYLLSASPPLVPEGLEEPPVFSPETWKSIGVFSSRVGVRFDSFAAAQLQDIAARPWALHWELPRETAEEVWLALQQFVHTVPLVYVYERVAWEPNNDTSESRRAMIASIFEQGRKLREAMEAANAEAAQQSTESVAVLEAGETQATGEADAGVAEPIV